MPGSARAGRPALAAVLPVLRCPVCGTGFSVVDASLRCDRGHSFDVSRQGYVNLTHGHRRPGTADTADMVAARERFLGRGHYAPIADALRSVAADVAGTAGGGIVLDLAGGTGHYLSAVLDALPESHGLDLDLSKPALARAARAHPRIAAIGSDVWQRLPVAQHCADIVMSVFGPRNPAETARALTPGGALIVATPTAEHLGEVIDDLGMIAVDPSKEERLAAALSDFEVAAEHVVAYQRHLLRADLVAMASMGPSAHHISAADLDRRVAATGEPTSVTVSVRIGVYRPR